MQAPGYRTSLPFGAGCCSEEQLCLSNIGLRQYSLWSGQASAALGNLVGILPGADKCQQKDVSRQQLLPGLFIPLIPTEAHKEFTRNPHRTLFIKTNKRALAVQNQLPSRSILAFLLSSSSFRSRGGSADGSYSLLSLSRRLSNFLQPVTSAEPCTSSSPIMQAPFPGTGMVSSTFIHHRQGCNKSFADKAQQYIDKREAWHRLEMAFVGD